MFNKILSVVIKVCGLVITAPVTWSVAGNVFADVAPDSLRLLMQVSALCMVEFVFLASWLALDSDKSAPDAVKVRHALVAGIMYAGLWLLAIQHGEGLAGLVFRSALGLALAGSIYDSGVYSLLKRDQQTDRDISRDWRVRRKARDLARTAAIFGLQSDNRIDLKQIELRESAELLRLQNEHARITTALQREHRSELQQIKRDDSDPSGAKRGNLTYPVERINSDRKAQKQKRQQLIHSALSLQPESRPSEIVAALQREMGISESTGWSDWRDYQQAEKVIGSNGNGNHE